LVVDETQIVCVVKLHDVWGRISPSLLSIVELGSNLLLSLQVQHGKLTCFPTLEINLVELLSDLRQVIHAAALLWPARAWHIVCFPLAEGKRFLLLRLTDEVKFALTVIRHVF
jgi:hypothetical protein